MKNVELKGIIPPIVTPMNDDDEQSEAAQAKPVRQNIFPRERFLKFADYTNPVKQYIIESI